MHHRSENIAEIAAAIAAAQAELNPAAKNAENPHLRNKYADIAAVWDAIREVLPKHGLSVVQTMVPRDDNKACVRTTLLHTSGQWLEGECALPVPKQDPQGYGSAITYARRYSLSAIIGVVSEDDDDGEGTKQGKKPAPKRAAPDEDGKPAGLALSAQVKRIQILLRDLGITDRDARIARLNKWLAANNAAEVTSTNELTTGQAAALIKVLEKQLAGLQPPTSSDPFPPRDTGTVAEREP